MLEEQIVGVYRNHYGDLISFQTSEGRIISYRKAIQEIEEGIIGGAFVNEQHSESYELPVVSLSENKSFDDLPNYH
ncbi:DUF3892 domain-containing protein [Cytobacillus spongiae]|jgi:hypothetical protein|uniref:DUF3892 domain-containing protein n=1 Tax=Cytobacillus spongiae TaxID=2901381 RepID=UPI001F3B8A48|nr:DUF3892 domain-containing protein [Cytobacillus spongiae]UII54548.1 DUF3892 domain-containing protein [Cytobacillus spongiae]